MGCLEILTQACTRATQQVTETGTCLLATADFSHLDADQLLVKNSQVQDNSSQVQPLDFSLSSLPRLWECYRNNPTGVGEEPDMGSYKSHRWRPHKWKVVCPGTQHQRNPHWSLCAPGEVETFYACLFIECITDPA